jgi:hypothetical protein
MVSNSTLKYKELLLKEFKELYGEENVIDAYIMYDLTYLIENTNMMNELEKRLNKQFEIFKETNERPKFGICQKVDYIDYLLNEIKKCQNNIQKYNKISELNNTGYAFITFSSIKAAKDCINDKCCGFTLPFNYSCVEAPGTIFIILIFRSK